jgi:hypothetical protein
LTKDYNNNSLTIDPKFGTVFFSGGSKTTASSPTPLNPICLRFYNYNPSYYSGGTSSAFSFTYNTIGSELESGSKTTDTDNRVLLPM